MTQAEVLKNQIKQQEEARKQTPATKKTTGTQKKRTIFTLVEDMKPEIRKSLPKHLDENRMVRLLTTTLRNNPKLQQAEPITFLAAAMEAAQLGLEPNTSLGECYILPYRRQGKMQAQLQLGYKGILKLAYNTGEYKSIYAHAVYANDEFSYSYGLNKDLQHIPADFPEGEPIYYYAVYHLKSGGFDFKVLSTKAIRQHAQKFSQSYGSDSSPWTKDFDSMALKTVLLGVLKYAPKAIELTKAVEADGTTKTAISENMSDVIDAEYMELSEVRESPEAYLYEQQEDAE